MLYQINNVGNVEILKNSQLPIVFNQPNHVQSWKYGKDFEEDGKIKALLRFENSNPIESISIGSDPISNHCMDVSVTKSKDDVIIDVVAQLENNNPKCMSEIE